MIARKTWKKVSCHLSLIHLTFCHENISYVSFLSEKGCCSELYLFFPIALKLGFTFPSQFYCCWILLSGFHVLYVFFALNILSFYMFKLYVCLKGINIIEMNILKEAVCICRSDRQKLYSIPSQLDMEDLYESDMNE